jgi:putative SOS response-associated peptidase YedK
VTSHYRLNAASHEIAVAFGASQGPDPWGGGTLSPGEFAPVIARSQKTGQRFMRPIVWGYPAPGAEGISPSGEVRWVPNVRNIESPFWIGNLRHSELRCIVPATAFMLRGKGRMNWFGVADLPVFAMAGIWRDLTDMPVFAIVTADASGLAREAGASAMPVILDLDKIDRWLCADWKEAQTLVAPYAGSLTPCV